MIMQWRWLWRSPVWRIWIVLALALVLVSQNNFKQGWESSEFDWNSSLLMVHWVILEICQNASCKRYALQEQYCLHFYTDSFCSELLARRCTIWKWPSVACIWAFHGGLQAKWWGVKLGLRSFVNRILARQVARENSFPLWEALHVWGVFDLDLG